MFDFLLAMVKRGQVEIVGESIAIGLNSMDDLFSFQNTRKVCMKKGGGKNKKEGRKGGEKLGFK